MREKGRRVSEGSFRKGTRAEVRRPLWTEATERGGGLVPQHGEGKMFGVEKARVLNAPNRTQRGAPMLRAWLSSPDAERVLDLSGACAEREAALTARYPHAEIWTAVDGLSSSS